MDISALRAELKVPGGKLIRIECAVKNGKIVSAKITGDFFMHPEETINSLEKNLVGSSISDKDIERHVNESLKADITLIGASNADFTSVIIQAIRGSPNIG